MRKKKLQQLNNTNSSLIYFLGVVILAAVMRILPHPPNVVPMTALSLFSGSKIKSRLSFVIPLSAMILSDMFLGFHSTIPYVYGSFVLIALIGRIIGNKKTVLFLCFISFLSSVLFFFITNFGVWATSGMYVRNINGLLSSYILGLPFFKNAVFGDLFYTLTLFYGYDFFHIMIVWLQKTLRRSMT